MYGGTFDQRNVLYPLIYRNMILLEQMKHTGRCFRFSFNYYQFSRVDDCKLKTSIYREAYVSNTNKSAAIERDRLRYT